MRREAAIDLELLLAGGLAARQRRIVEEREPHCALDLQRAIPGQEHDGAVGIDPGGGRTAVRCRFRDKSEHLLLP
ncbi:hypothetical protein [Rhodopseudomonas palustris]|uniref:hypothetical protein n=1 Tax=Rhodopseudomonas palustris TaxID=1076 RepID=UPI0034E9615F